MFASASAPLVTVVVPSYCHEKFIADALQSVHDQTYRPIELIVIDDASPDSTFQEAARWASSIDADARFDNFVLLRNAANLGAHGSINRGCALARGEFITILNSDDLFHPNRLQKILAEMQRRRAHLGFSRVCPIDGHGALLPPLRLPPQLYGVFDAADQALANKPSLRHALLDRNIAISTGNLLFTRELYRKIGPFADLKYVHDWDFALRSTLLAEPVYVPEDLYLYRIHGSNSFSELGNIAALETAIVMARLKIAAGKNKIVDEPL